MSIDTLGSCISKRTCRVSVTEVVLEGRSLGDLGRRTVLFGEQGLVSGLRLQVLEQQEVDVVQRHSELTAWKDRREDLKTA